MTNHIYNLINNTNYISFIKNTILTRNNIFLNFLFLLTLTYIIIFHIIYSLWYGISILETLNISNYYIFVYIYIIIYSLHTTTQISSIIIDYICDEVIQNLLKYCYYIVLIYSIICIYII